MKTTDQMEPDRDVLASMGERFSAAYERAAQEYQTRTTEDPKDLGAYLGLAETNVLLYIFGYSYRSVTIPSAREAVRRAAVLSSSSAEVSRLRGILSFLDWDWQAAEDWLRDAIRKNPTDLNARHWYSLFLVAMGRFDEAMTESDELMQLDLDDDYLVGRGSLLYFQHRFAELRDLMHRAIAKDPEAPWGYDWLGMAYNGLEQHDEAIRTYHRAFVLSDGTAEVGAGYGHALGMAGQEGPARVIADFYASIASDRYVPPVQRAYIHIGIGEHDEAIRLLEQAYAERSWFLCFAMVEPWLDPLREDETFQDILGRMQFPVEPLD